LDPISYDERFYARVTSLRSDLISVVCELQGYIIGIAVARYETQATSYDKGLVDCTLEGKELLYLMTLVVDPAFRRTGVGMDVILL
jgi:GNAT superfamily N-acetyltransferase